MSYHFKHDCTVILVLKLPENVAFGITWYVINTFKKNLVSKIKSVQRHYIYNSETYIVLVLKRGDCFFSLNVRDLWLCYLHYEQYERDCSWPYLGLTLWNNCPRARCLMVLFCPILSNSWTNSLSVRPAITSTYTITDNTHVVMSPNSAQSFNINMRQLNFSVPVLL